MRYTLAQININDTFWQGTGINNDGTNGPFNFQFKNVYANATPAQVNSLSRNSGGCWQVKYTALSTHSFKSL